MHRSALHRLVILAATFFVVVSVVLVSCTPTPKVITKEKKVTREVTRVVVEVVEKVVTQLVEQVVKETVLIEAPPEIIEREVTVLVQAPPEIVEVVVTATPTPAAAQVLNLRATWIDSIDPAYASPDEALNIVTEAFIGPMRQNEETSEVEPGMATSWEVSDDLQTWTFNLRTDVPWVSYNSATRSVEPVTDASGDIRYVTAYDFEYGIMRILAPETDSNDAYLLSDVIEGAEDFSYGSGSATEVGVEALDDSTLDIRLIEPASYFDAIADTWVMVAQPEWHIEAQGERWTEQDYFQGYGPYVLKEWVGYSHLTLIKNPYWPGTDSIPRPTVQEITWWLIDDDDAAWLAYLAGELDVLQVSEDVLATAQADPQLAAQLVAQPELGTYFDGFNVEKPPFDDPNVRLAFSLAVDRQALIDEIAQGAHEPAHWFSPPGLRGAPTLEDYPTLGVSYEPDEARALLDQVYPDRSQMPLVTLAFPDASPHAEIAAVVQQMWIDTLDVEVELEPMSWSVYIDALNTDPPQVWGLRLYNTSCADVHAFLPSVFYTDSFFSEWFNWTSSDFDVLIDQAAASLSTAERAEWYALAEDLLVRQEVVIVPLYWRARSVLTQPYIQRTYSQIGGIERLEKWSVLGH